MPPVIKSPYVLNNLSCFNNLLWNLLGKYIFLIPTASLDKGATSLGFSPASPHPISVTKNVKSDEI